VFALPSTALAAALPAVTEEAVAGWPCDSKAPAAAARGPVVTSTRAASNAIAKATM
jgi:hypothetical protein